MTITEFLLARIAEDSRLASEAKWAMQGAWFPSADDAVDALVQACSPDRVLAECAAKRAIIAEHECLEAGEGFTPDWYSRDACLACETKSWPCRTVSALLAVYADHPDYQTEWKLDTHSEAG